MESAVAQAIAEATPPAGIAAAPEAATPPEQAQTEVAASQPAAVPEEWIEVPDPENPNEIYTKVPKDPAKLGEWLVNRNRTFSELNRQKTALETEVEFLRRQGQAPQQQPQAVAPVLPGVAPAADPEVTELANEKFLAYSRTYQGEPEQIWAAAMRDAEVEISAERRAFRKLEAIKAQSENDRIVQENPVLSSEFGRQVFDEYGGRMTAKMHLALVKQRALETGVDLSAYGIRPTLSPSTKASVATGAAARTAALSTPPAQAAVAPAAAKPPDPALYAEYQKTVNTGNYNEEQKAKLWQLMLARYDERRGA